MNKRILLSAMAGMLAVNLRSNAIPDTFSVPYTYPDASQKKGANRKVGVSKQKRAKRKRKNKRKRK